LFQNCHPERFVEIVILSEDARQRGAAEGPVVVLELRI
jgi:hypothetical protein